MVLGPQGPGRVGRRRFNVTERAVPRGGPLVVVARVPFGPDTGAPASAGSRRGAARACVAGADAVSTDAAADTVPAAAGVRSVTRGGRPRRATSRRVPSLTVVLARAVVREATRHPDARRDTQLWRRALAIASSLAAACAPTARCPALCTAGRCQVPAAPLPLREQRPARDGAARTPRSAAIGVVQGCRRAPTVPGRRGERRAARVRGGRRWRCDTAPDGFWRARCAAVARGCAPCSASAGSPPWDERVRAAGASSSRAKALNWAPRRRSGSGIRMIIKANMCSDGRRGLGRNRCAYAQTGQMQAKRAPSPARNPAMDLMTRRLRRRRGRAIATRRRVRPRRR